MDNCRNHNNARGNRMKKRVLGALLALVTSLAGQQALSAEGGTLYFGLSGEPPSLETIINSGTSARTVRLAIHRGLFNYGPDGQRSSALAASYEASPAALTYTFRLRAATFHDGSALPRQT